MEIYANFEPQVFQDFLCKNIIFQSARELLRIASVQKRNKENHSEKESVFFHPLSFVSGVFHHYGNA